MKFRFFSGVFSLRKSCAILRHTFFLYNKKKKHLPQVVSDQIEKCLLDLQDSIMKKQKESASKNAKELQELASVYLKKNTIEKAKDTLVTLALALCAAVIIRQSWFELYEIPTGSMRPTLKEKDRLYVSKTTFGINVPLTTNHFVFEPDLVMRNGIFVFTGENMDIKDVDTKYFYIFPGKKQYIKRMMARPGDTVYFYGGRMYGIDANGSDISHLFQIEKLDKIEHIPFIYPEGKVSLGAKNISDLYTSVTIYQMNEAVARLNVLNGNQVTGEMLRVCPTASRCPPPVKEYYDLWGFRNFGMASIITKEEARLTSESDPSELALADYFLMIKHHPSIQSAKIGRDERGRLRPMLGISTSFMPLDEEHIKEIFKNLYTARFVVKNGFAYRYGSSPAQIGKGSFLPRLEGVPDGTYEFYNGKAYEIKWQGIEKELPSTHALCQFSIDRTIMLYNLGIEFDKRFSPSMRYNISPSRYTYFRAGDLYLLGAPIVKESSLRMNQFLEREKQKQQTQNLQQPYVPFEDLGPPVLKNGALDIDMIKNYGLTIPPESYLALGDNHAMSADSRDFGFVPQNNVRGAPDLIFWPVGKRWGYPNQPPYPFFNLPRTIVWIVLSVFIGGYFIYARKKNKLPLIIKK